MQIAISSLAFKGFSVEEMIAACQAQGWILEFSSSLPHRADMKEVFLQAPIPKYIHNYFPAPATPFVINLASSNEDIRRKSIEHCKQGLTLAKQIQSQFYSAHAGFCIDPNPLELGKPISFEHDFDKVAHWKTFVESVQEVLAFADSLGLGFLIENNVIAPFNYREGINPLFCTGAEEMLQLLHDLGNHPRLGLLLDTAHLKVSAKTEGFNAKEAVEQLTDKISCIHHSDNDGNSDSNSLLPQDYWFLEYIGRFENLLHVVEVRNLSLEAITQQLGLLQYGA